MPTYRNWSNSFQSNYTSLYHPSSEIEIIEIVEKANRTGQKLKVVGSGHSCSLIAQSDEGILISLDRYNQVLHADAVTGLVTVQAGIKLGDLCLQLKKHKLALKNMGTIDEQTMAGAIATGTHGTGINQPAIDQQIHSFTIITTNGNVLSASRNENKELFEAGKVGLGALGVLSTVTIKCVPDFKMSVEMYPAPLHQVLKDIPHLQENSYFRFWWFPHTGMAQVWKANPTKDEVSKANKWSKWFQSIFIGNYLTEFGLWLTSFFPKTIPSFNKLIYKISFSKAKRFVEPAYESFVIPIKTKQMVMEYAIAEKDAKAAIKEMETFIESNSFNVHLPVEVRFAPANESWMSMAYRRVTCYIGIITYQPFGRKIPYEKYFLEIHKILKKYDARPHWAKVHFFSTKQLAEKYEQWKEFEKIKDRNDPTKMLENSFLEKLFRET